MNKLPILPIILSILLLTACKSTSKQPNNLAQSSNQDKQTSAFLLNETKSQPSSSSENASNSIPSGSQPSSVPLEKATKTEQSNGTTLGSSSTVPSSTEQKSKSPVGGRINEFLNKHKALPEGDKIVFQDEQDLDTNGDMEIVLATGRSNDIHHIFVLRDKGDHYENLSGDNGIDERGGYETNDVKVVKLRGSNLRYIYVSKTNGGPMNGFHLYELRDNKVEFLDGRNNPTGAGETKLTDLDSDGTYGGYVDYQYSYDVNYIPITSIYKFNGSTFDLHAIEVSFPTLPTEPEDVLEEFIKLSLLNIKDGQAVPSIQKRMEQLSTGYHLQISEDEAYGLHEFIIMGDIDKSKERHVDSNHIVIPVRYFGKSGKVSIEFYLSYENGHWLVNSVQKLS